MFAADVRLLRLMNPAQYPDKRRIYNEPLQVDLVSGSALFIRATYFHELGGFDTNFFLYCEEEDIALRMRKSNHAVFLVPAARKVSGHQKGILYFLFIFLLKALRFF